MLSNSRLWCVDVVTGLMSAAPILVRIDVAFNQHLVCGDKSTELPVGVLICVEEKNVSSECSFLLKFLGE